MIDKRLKFIAVVGPTATGKTDLSLRLAEALGGEIVCADSRTLYRKMDIGTAKPTLKEQARVPHHLLDVLDPGEYLSAPTFKRLAEAAITDIASRGSVPLLVGGSGLYADAVLFDYQFPAEADPERRVRLEAMDDQELLKLLATEDSRAYNQVDLANRRRVIRAIEIAGYVPVKLQKILPQALVLGIMLNKEVVQHRIKNRIEKMLEEGFIDEVTMIGETFGWENSAMNIIGYRAFKNYVLGDKTLSQAKSDFAKADLALYKKQVTWFKRNSFIQWVNSAEEAERLSIEFLHEDV